MWLWIVLLLPVVIAFSPQYAEEGPDTTYSCNCILREEYQPSTTTTTVNPAQAENISLPPISQAISDRLPARFWSLYNAQFKRNGKSDLLSSSFLDRILSVFRRRTTPTPLEPQNDMPGTALRGLGKTIFTKYIERLRREWNVLDRFVCKCQGNMLKVLDARNYLSLTILHD